MAGASGLLAGSAFFIALEIVFWFGVQFFGSKGGKGLAIKFTAGSSAENAFPCRL